MTLACAIRGFVLVLAFVTAGCGATGPVADASPDATVADVAAGDAAGDAASDAVDASAVDGRPVNDTVVMPAGPWRGPFHVDFGASLESTFAGAALRHIALSANLGQFDFATTMLPAFSPQTVDWTAQTGFRLVHAYATERSNLHVSFVYCRDGVVTGTYYESLTELLDYHADSVGRPCPVSAGSSDLAVEIRPLESLPDGLLYVTGVSIRGSAVQLETDGHGTVDLAGIHWDVSAFGFVDCTTRCGTPGWWEVHSLLRAPGGATAFTILYLMLDDRTRIRANYSLRLDTPAPLANARFDAAWTVE